MSSPDTYRYAAFISYRHVKSDRRWAVWLHRALERYRVPKSARRELGLPAKVGRFFRDEDEVSASTDLNTEIEKALQESKFLIVVCSPHAPGSKWVNREIERFREMGRGNRILALLIEGEPKDSFPTALREIAAVGTLDQGHASILEEPEPLAADVRPAHLGFTRRVQRSAKLRLLSTILGCRFDELRRRDQEHRQRVMAGIAIASVAFALILGGLSWLATRNAQGWRAALDDYDRLGDVPKLRDLIADADGLWPCDPSKAPAMHAWLDRAEDLQRRVPGHRETLERLRQRATPIAAESRLNESAPTDSRPRKLPTPAEQFKHDTTAKLVADLTAFVDPDRHKGLLEDVRARLTFAESVERETLVKHADAWNRAIDAIAANPKYHGLAMKPQLGLIPIEEDPKSHLWEFVHLQTATPRTDPIPKRGDNGRLVGTEDMGIVFVLLPSGTFKMGAVKLYGDRAPTDPNVDPEAYSDESPVTEVRLDPYFISKYEMTQGQWVRLVGKNPSHYRPATIFGGKIVDLRNPVEQVSYEDCDLWLGRLGLVLPSEAQWEYAARAGTTTPWWCGSQKETLATAANIADAFARHNGGSTNWVFETWSDGYSIHAPVGSLRPNAFGLHDVLGNVAEWCRDAYGVYDVIPGAFDGVRQPSSWGSRVARGGGFLMDASGARCAVRNNYAPEVRHNYIGVRPARRLNP